MLGGETDTRPISRLSRSTAPSEKAAQKPYSAQYRSPASLARSARPALPLFSTGNQFLATARLLSRNNAVSSVESGRIRRFSPNSSKTKKKVCFSLCHPFEQTKTTITKKVSKFKSCTVSQLATKVSSCVLQVLVALRLRIGLCKVD